MKSSIVRSSRSRSILVATFAATLALGAGCAVATESETVEERAGTTDQAIINGTVDTRNLAVVGLQGPGGSIYGTGTIVKVNEARRTAYVLTAAHAALTTPYSIVYDDASGRRIQLLGSARASRVHPNYVRSADRKYDVAVFEVNGAGTNTPVIPLLPTATDALVQGNTVEVSGWGRFDEAGRAARTRHRMTKPLLSVDGTMVHWDNGGTMGSCSGDSGGAVIRTYAGGPAVVGVYHGRSGDTEPSCNQDGAIGDAVRVQNVRDWINQNIASLQGGECRGSTPSAADAQCPSDRYCDDGGLLRATQDDDLNICAPRKENGAMCLRDRVCASNNCSAGFCRP